ncbi:MAG: RNase adapter RapZ [bacterium]
MEGLNLVVVTGLSGSGKTTVAKAFEDLGYYCVDNLPAPLLGDFVQLAKGSSPQLERVLVVMDVREGSFLGSAPDELRAVRDEVSSLTVVFLECSEEGLVRRFREVRRAHPLDSSSIVNGVAHERLLLGEFRAMAQRVIDTSSLNVHALRRIVQEEFGRDRIPALEVALVSFGFRNGLPQDADVVFDVRFLPNPHYEAELRDHDGREPRVRTFVFRGGEAEAFLAHVEGLLRFLLPRYHREGKHLVSIAVGCTGGKHRSVAIVEALGERLKDVESCKFSVRHRDAVPAATT